MNFECVEVCWDLFVRCQRIVNCSSQVCWRQVNLHELWLQKEKDDEFNGCLGCENDKIWIQSRFDQRKTCQSQRWSQDCEQRNWLGWIIAKRYWSLFCADKKKFSFWWIEKQFVQVQLHPMSVKLLVSSVSRDRSEFVGVRDVQYSNSVWPLPREPFIKYVTLFLMIFDPLSQTVTNLGPPKTYVTLRNKKLIIWC